MAGKLLNLLPVWLYFPHDVIFVRNATESANPCVNPRVIFGLTFGLTGCAVSQGYPTVALNEAFASKATVVAVKAPSRRYSDDFFNVPLGDYRVINTQFSDPVRSDREYVKNKTVDNTGWNLLLQGQVILEKKTYEQYMVVLQRDFSFQINSAEGAAVTASCRYAVSLLENEASAALSLNLSGSERRNPDAESIDIADWLQTAIQCDFGQGGDQWRVGVIESVDSEAQIELTSPNKTYRGERLYDSFASTPATGGPRSASLLNDNTGALSGVDFFDAEQQMSAVSLTEFNSAIWFDPSLSVTEQEAMLGVGYALILASWKGMGD